MSQSAQAPIASDSIEDARSRGAAPQRPRHREDGVGRLLRSGHRPSGLRRGRAGAGPIRDATTPGDGNWAGTVPSRRVARPDRAPVKRSIGPLPRIARVRRTYRQPEVEDVAAATVRGDPRQPAPGTGRPGRPDRDHGRQPGDRRDRRRSPGRPSTRSDRSGSTRSSWRPWAATAAGPPRASGPCSPSWASPRRPSAARSGPRWIPSSSAPTRSACRSTSTATPTRPTASSC